MSDSRSVFGEFAEDFERCATENAYNARYYGPAFLDLIGEVSGQRV